MDQGGSVGENEDSDDYPETLVLGKADRPSLVVEYETDDREMANDFDSFGIPKKEIFRRVFGSIHHSVCCAV